MVDPCRASLQPKFLSLSLSLSLSLFLFLFRLRSPTSLYLAPPSLPETAPTGKEKATKDKSPLHLGCVFPNNDLFNSGHSFRIGPAFVVFSMVRGTRFVEFIAIDSL